MTEPDVDVTDRFLTTTLGTRKEGWLFLGYKRQEVAGGRREQVHQEAFRWPVDQDRAMAWIEDKAPRHPLYWCPLLRKTKRRQRGNAVSRRWLWVDLDGAPVDGDLIEQLQPVQVLSGRPGHRHLYVPLRQSLDRDAWHAQARGLRDALGGAADAKIADNDLLRLPGSLNFRTTPPTRVAIEPGERRVWDVAAFRTVVPPATSRTCNRVAERVTGAEHVPWASIPRPVRTALRVDTGDRSNDLYLIVRTCMENGLTGNQTAGLLEGHPAAERFEQQGRLYHQIEVIREKEPMGKKTVPAKKRQGGDAPTPPDDEWEPPVPLARRPQPIPVEAMGPVLGPLVKAVAEAIQVPTDLVANLALPLITTAARGCWLIQIQDNWTESLCLATLSVAASGERKSAVVRLLSKPLRDAERQAFKAARENIAAQEADHWVKQDQVEQLRKKISKEQTPELVETYARASVELANTQVDKPPVFIADDVTPEKLAQLLGEQNGALGVISSEATLLHIMAGRHSGKPNLEVVLQATSGDPIRVNRLSRDSVSIEHTALSLGLCIQPKLLSQFGQGPYRDSGLLARFLYVLPEARVGSRSTDERPVPTAVGSEWAAALTAIVNTSADLLTRALALTRDQGSSVDIVDAIRRVRFDASATKLFKKFRDWLEPKLHPHHGELSALADWGSKLPGTVARIAGALELLGNPNAVLIQGHTMVNAIQIAKSYIGHAEAAFRLLHARSDDLFRADEVMDWIVHHGSEVVTLREVHRALEGRSWVNSADDVRAALGTLVEYGHLRRIEATSGQRGRPSERYQVNPHSIDNNDKNSKTALMANIDTKSHPSKSIDNNDKTQSSSALTRTREEEKPWLCPACLGLVELRISRSRELRPAVWIVPNHREDCAVAVGKDKEPAENQEVGLSDESMYRERVSPNGGTRK